MWRWPRNWPLSWLSGATPTNAEAWASPMRPSSGQQGQHGKRADPADASDLLHALGLGREFGVGGDVRIDQRVEFGELFCQLLLPRPRQLEEHRQRRVLAAVELVGDEGDEFLAGPHQFGELHFSLERRPVRRRLEPLAVVAQHGGVDGIGLGQPAAGPGKVADLPGVDDADGTCA